MDNATIATAIAGLLGLSSGAIAAWMARGNQIHDLRWQLESLADENEAYSRRIGLVRAENIRLRPLAEEGEKVLAQRTAALAKANAVNAARHAEKAV